MQANKNIREQRTIRTARLRSRIEASNQQIQHLNHHYFQIPLPEHHNTHAYFSNQPNITHLSNVSYHSIDPPELNERKQQIKQKIKFRVKQEIWNLLQKSSQKELILQDVPQQLSQTECKEKEKTHSSAFIMGRSYARVNRESFVSRRNWSYEEARKNDRSASKEFPERRGRVNQIRPRRAWSSSVKMREKDKALMSKQEFRINRSYIQMQKMDSYNIEPWKAVDDPEHHFIQ